MRFVGVSRAAGGGLRPHHVVGVVVLCLLTVLAVPAFAQPYPPGEGPEVLDRVIDVPPPVDAVDRGEQIRPTQTLPAPSAPAAERAEVLGRRLALSGVDALMIAGLGGMLLLAGGVVLRARRGGSH